MKVELVSSEVILEDIEFAILANLCGMERVFGFSGEQLTGLEKDKFILILHQMVKKKILLMQEKIEILSPYKEAFERIKNATKAIIIESASDQLPVKCCYVGKDQLVTVTETLATRADAIRLYERTREELWDSLKEEEYLTYGVDQVEYGKNEEKQILTNFKIYDLHQEKLLNSIQLVHNEMELYLQVVSKEEIREFLQYTEEQLRRMIEREIGGDNHGEGGCIRSILE